MRAAAAITSITMNAGTSLRRDGIRRFAESSIEPEPFAGRTRPGLAPFVQAFQSPATSAVVARALTRGRPPLACRKYRNRLRTMGAIKHSGATLRRIVSLATAAALVFANVPAQAQKAPPIVRDAEIEQLLREYTQPILRVAGLAKQNVQVVIINERTFNAFVADGRRIFVNAGALVESEVPNQIIGVLAHETGHIAGGHLARLREQLARANTQSILAMLLGVGAMVAAGRSGNADLGQAGMAAITGPQAAIQNSLFSYVRAQEDQADRAAVRFLTETGQSPK